MKRTALALIPLLLVSALAGTLFANLAEANPMNKNVGVVDPDAETEPPTITILSPQNGATYDVNNVNFSCIVSVGESKTAYKTDIAVVYFEEDWLPNITYAFEYRTPDPFTLGGKHDFPPTFTYNLNLTEIPDGKHNITIHARELGYYLFNAHLFWYDSFSIDVSSSISFTIAGLPSISILSLENKTYNTSDIPLNFTVNEPVSKISYVLDGLENVTIDGNTTLTRLSDGKHNVTVYATDEAGNTGISETMYFNVDTPEPFPTALVTASVVSIAAIIVGLAFYFKKRKR